MYRSLSGRKEYQFIPQQSLTVRLWKFAFSPQKNGSLPIIILVFRGKPLINYTVKGQISTWKLVISPHERARHFGIHSSGHARRHFEISPPLPCRPSSNTSYVDSRGVFDPSGPESESTLGICRVAIGPITHKGYCAGTLSVRYGERRFTKPGGCKQT